jgi:hypothetical protein
MRLFGWYLPCGGGAMRKLILAAVLVVVWAGVAFGEDWMGYVLRRNYWGVDYYWVHDGSKWGEVVLMDKK